MNSEFPEPNPSPQELLEAQITALLLGELPEAEAAALHEKIAADPELVKLHARLGLTIGLVKEAIASPASAELAAPEGLKLAEEKREKLLAAFKEKGRATPSRRAARTPILVEFRTWAALAAMIVFLFAISALFFPSLSFFSAISTTRGRSLTLALPPGGGGQFDRSTEPEPAEERFGGARSVSELRRTLSKNTPDVPPLATPAPAREEAEERGRVIAGKPAAQARAGVPTTSLATAPQKQTAGRTEALARSYKAFSDSSGLANDKTKAPEEDLLRIPLPKVESEKLSEISQNEGKETFFAVTPNDSNARGFAVNGAANNTWDMNLLTGAAEPKAEENRFLGRYAYTVSGGFGGGGGGIGGAMPTLGDRPELGVEFKPQEKLQILGFGASDAESKKGLSVGEPEFSGVLEKPAEKQVAATSEVDRFGRDKSMAQAANGPAVDQLGDIAVSGRRDRARGREVQLQFGDSIAAAPAPKEPAIVSAGAVVAPATVTGVAGGLTFAPEPANRGVVARDLAAAHPAKPTQSEPTKELPEAAKAGPRAELQKVSQELETQEKVRDSIAGRIEQEKLDQKIPKAGQVEVFDRAETEAGKSRSLLERLQGVKRMARVEVSPDASDTSALIAGTVQAANKYDPYFLQTESEKLKSQKVLSGVISNLNLTEAWAAENGGKKLGELQAYEKLKKMVEVRQPKGSSVAEIEVRDQKPEEAARIANTIAEVYRDVRNEQKKEASQRGIQVLEDELKKVDQNLAEKKAELERIKREKGIEDKPITPRPTANAAIPQPEVAVKENAFSTFSLNVSDVSFKLAAASLEKGVLPDAAGIRSEEFINAFDYRDPAAVGSAPVAFAWERARDPFAQDRDLLRFSVKTGASGREAGRPLNLVLLLDNSGSMERADRVRIIQECLRVLAGQLQAQDVVSVVTFARTARLWVDGLPGSSAAELPGRVGNLTPEGGTNLEEAMRVAYETAAKHFQANGVNRVVLLTDGAANLGDVQPESLKKNVEAHRKQGVALDCFGIGWEGLNDDLLEQLSRNGDGRYGFVNSPEEASANFATQLAGALHVAASDVKVQVEFNPKRTTIFRQIGYAKHQLTKEQFRDNTVDAAELGAAEAGNAMYVVQTNPAGEGPIATVRVRFKVPGTNDYREQEWPVPYEGAARDLEDSSPTLRLAASAAEFSEWLAANPYAAEVTPDRLLALMANVPQAFPNDPRPKQLESMIRQAKSIAGK